MKNGTFIFAVVATILCATIVYMANTARFFGVFLARFFPCTNTPGNSFPCYGMYDIGIMLVAAMLGASFFVIILYELYKSITTWRSNASLIALGSLSLVLLVGIAIPKLTVHDLVEVSPSLKQCALYGARISLNNPIERVALWLGKSRITQVNVNDNDVGVESFTIFRIPLAWLRGYPSMQSGVTCDFFAPNIVGNGALRLDFVPAGWYAHIRDTSTITNVILTKEKELPNVGATELAAYGEQIDISISTTSLSAEAYIEKQGLTAPIATQQRWNTFEGHKMFSVSLPMGSTIILFGGNKVQTFISNYPEDSADFWKVIGYYAQDPSFGKISRDETLNNCKNVILPQGQEYDIVSDSETGYVTVGYWLGTVPGMGGKETYAFFNYNDDLTQCTSSVRKLLSTVKAGAEKHDSDMKNNFTR